MNLKFLLYYVDYEYKKLCDNSINEFDMNDGVLLDTYKLALNSGLSYAYLFNLLKKYPKLSERLQIYIDDELKKLATFKNSMICLKDLFEKEDVDHLYIKLYRGIPYIPRDIDVLIKEKDISRVIKVFKKNGFKVLTYEGGVENKCKKNGLIDIDLYQGFYYLSNKFIDEHFLWEKPRMVDIFGNKYQIPNIEADLVTLFIHALLGHRQLSLLDFIYAKDLLKKDINFNHIIQMTNIFSWTSGFYKLYSIIKELHKDLYFQSADSLSLNVNFPILFNSQLLLSEFIHIQNLDKKKKILFLISTLMDKILHEYIEFQNATTMQMPIKYKEYLMIILHKIRGSIGDKKIIFSL